nr:GMC family oxidoreductase [Dactylosporangium thailandense]
MRTLAPGVRILLVDAGTAGTGQHRDNVEPPGPPEPPVFDTGQHATGAEPRPATSPVFGPDSDLPGYAQATRSGGLGTTWTCATPTPDGTEREPAIPAPEWAAALAEARRLLRVRPDSWPRVDGLLDALRAGYPDLPPDRGVAMMPTAMTRTGDRPHWTGPADILGDVKSFEIWSSTTCRRLILRAGRVVAVHLNDTEIRVGAVAVAADAVRTPQLLWDSGIRPAALGRYAADHLQLLAAVAWPGSRVPARWGRDRTAAMLWVPYSDRHPYHGQVMLFDQRAEDDAMVVGLSWLVPPVIDAGNHLTFDPPHVTYPLSDEDHRRVRGATDDIRRAMVALGDRVLPGGEPRLLPRGSSLHLTGTVRMGGRPDGTSVCDPHGRVWGVPNLFVAGNGVLSASTAGNPTLTSVALALRSAAATVRSLKP